MADQSVITLLTMPSAATVPSTGISMCWHAHCPYTNRSLSYPKKSIIIFGEDRRFHLHKIAILQYRDAHTHPSKSVKILMARGVNSYRTKRHLIGLH
jgi:hypothetical protein